MRVLFLDIDGVLNSSRSVVATGFFPLKLTDQANFDPIAVGLVRKLCELGDIKIVLSSSWRIHYRFEEVGAALNLPVVGATENLNMMRGFEIQKWLNNHPECEQFCIVDDSSDMLPNQLHRFVRTDPDDGLTWGNYRTLCSLFGIEGKLLVAF